MRENFCRCLACPRRMQFAHIAEATDAGGTYQFLSLCVSLSKFNFRLATDQGGTLWPSKIGNNVCRSSMQCSASALLYTLHVSCALLPTRTLVFPQRNMRCSQLCCARCMQTAQRKQTLAPAKHPSRMPCFGSSLPCLPLSLVECCCRLLGNVVCDWKAGQRVPS